VVAQALLPRADGKGRVAVAEILVNVPAVANLIREGKAFQLPSVMQTGRAQGMLTFDTSINELLRTGVISQKEGQTFLARRTAGSKRA
jgi:twitching motility protein PilT